MAQQKRQEGQTEEAVPEEAVPEEAVPEKVICGMRVISTSHGGRRAEIVTYVGDGSRRRSITRHVRMSGGGLWIGRNPDDAGLGQLDAAEEEVAVAEKRHSILGAFAKMSVKDIKSALDCLAGGDEESRKKLPEGFTATLENIPEGQRSSPGTVKTAFQNVLAGQRSVLSEARKKAKELGKKFPREVVFTA